MIPNLVLFAERALYYGFPVRKNSLVERSMVRIVIGVDVVDSLMVLNDDCLVFDLEETN